MTTNFDSIKIANGRFVNVGSELESFGRRCVVVGWRKGCGQKDCVNIAHATGLVVAPINENGKIIDAKWVAEPSLCR